MPENDKKTSGRIVTMSSDEREFGHFMDSLAKLLAKKVHFEREVAPVRTNARTRMARRVLTVHLNASDDLPLEELASATREARRRSNSDTASRGEAPLSLNVESSNWPEARQVIADILKE